MIDIGADLQRAFDEGYEKGKADRPRGEWTHRNSYWHTAICSNCNKATMFEEWDEEVVEYDFCPNCLIVATATPTDKEEYEAYERWKERKRNERSD